MMCDLRLLYETIDFRFIHGTAGTQQFLERLLLRALGDRQIFIHQMLQILLRCQTEPAGAVHDCRQLLFTQTADRQS